MSAHEAKMEDQEADLEGQLAAQAQSVIMTGGNQNEFESPFRTFEAVAKMFGKSAKKGAELASLAKRLGAAAG
jgi:hypothetical protein